MIFITGDIHGDPQPRLNTTVFPEQKEMTKEDFVIICGDFGCVFAQSETKEEKHMLDWLESKPFATLFCDGNHENFDRLDAMEVEEWHGGRVHRLRPSVLHLMRGELFTLHEKSFFVFGGARSHDIRDGILESGDPRIKRWNRDYSKLFRVNRISWWEQEMPSKEEMDHGLDTLKKAGGKVDFIITHELPTSALTLYSAMYCSVGKYKPNELNDYLEQVRCETEYRHWFCGHYHDNRNLNRTEHILYEQLIPIE